MNRSDEKVGNQVTYEIPADPAQRIRRRRLVVGAIAIGVLALACAIVLGAMGTITTSMASVLGTLGTIVVGLNTVAYEWPTTGATAPTAAVMSKHQQMTAIVTGDNSATAFTITHNFGLSTAEITAGFPEVLFEPILAAGITAAPFILSKTANTVVCTCTAFTGAGLRVRVRRPHTMDR